MLALLFRFGRWLLGGLIDIVPTLVGRFLVSAGVGVVTYQGVDVALAFLKTMAVSNVTALPASVYSLIGVLKIGVCISMVASAVAIRLGIQGLTSGTLKRWVKK